MRNQKQSLREAIKMNEQNARGRKQLLILVGVLVLIIALACGVVMSIYKSYSDKRQREFDANAQAARQAMVGALKKKYDADFKIGKLQLNSNAGSGAVSWSGLAYTLDKDPVEFGVAWDGQNVEDSFLSSKWSKSAQKEIEPLVKLALGKDTWFKYEVAFRGTLVDKYFEKIKRMSYAEVMKAYPDQMMGRITCDAFRQKDINKRVESVGIMKLYDGYFKPKGFYETDFTVHFFETSFKKTEEYRNIIKYWTMDSSKLKSEGKFYKAFFIDFEHDKKVTLEMLLNQFY